MITTQNDKLCYKTFFTNGNHKGFSDTTEKNGGANAGFRPHDLLEAALATCLNMWVRMCAENHHMSLSTVTTQVDIDRSHPEKVVFRYDIDIDGDITEEQRRKLLQIAKTCPVHKTLSKDISFLNTGTMTAQA